MSANSQNVKQKGDLEISVYCDDSWSLPNLGVINFHLVSDVYGAELVKMIHWLVFSVFGMNTGGNPQQCYLGL